MAQTNQATRKWQAVDSRFGRMLEGFTRLREQVQKLKPREQAGKKATPITQGKKHPAKTSKAKKAA